MYGILLFSFSCDKNIKSRRKKNQTLVCEGSSAIHTTLKYNTSIWNMYIFSRKEFSEKAAGNTNISPCNGED